MKIVIKHYVSKALLEKFDYDTSDLKNDDVLYLSSDPFDRILSESYVSNFDEIGDSCDDESLIIVENRKYYDRDVRYDYNSNRIWLFYEEESEVI